MPNDFLERRIHIRPRWAVYSLLLLLAVCVAAYSVHGNRIDALEDELTARELSLAEAENQLKALETELALRGEDAYIARIAREKYGYLMEGEIRYMFEGTKAPEHVAPSMPVSFYPLETPAPEVTVLNPS